MTNDLPIWISVAAVLVAINMITVFMFGWDKRAARLKIRRIRESTLLFWVSIGGCIGAIFGQQYFRHKTHKKPFKNQMWAIIFGQTILVGFFAAWRFMA